MKSVDKGLESPIGKMLVEKNLVSANTKVSERGEMESKIINAGNVFLNIANLQEMSNGEDSSMFHYYNTLPGVEDFPMYFTEAERAYLEGSPFLDVIDN